MAKKAATKVQGIKVCLTVKLLLRNIYCNVIVRTDKIKINNCKIIYLCDPSINLSSAGLKLLRLNKSLTHSNRLTEITKSEHAYDKTYTSTSLICPLTNC